MLAQPGDWLAPLTVVVDFNTFAGPANVSKATSTSSTSRTPVPATHGASLGPTLLVMSEALESQSLARSRSPRPIRSEAHNRAVARSEENRPRSVHGQIGHAREPPLRVQPADACSKPAELQRPHNTNKIENRYENHIQTHPNIKRRCLAFVFPCSSDPRTVFFTKFPLQKLLLHQHLGEITWRFAMFTRFQQHSDSVLYGFWKTIQKTHVSILYKTLDDVRRRTTSHGSRQGQTTSHQAPSHILCKFSAPAMLRAIATTNAGNEKL